MVQGRRSAVLHIRPAAALHGAIRIPGDKSISHRYVMLGGIASGTTTITNLAPGADVAATIACMQGLGVRVVERGADGITVTGQGWSGLRTPAGPLDARNSGTTMRLLTGLIAGRPLTVTLVGDASLQRRPMARVIEPLSAMGATIHAEVGHAPLVIHGGHLQGIEWTPPVPSAQVKSAIMLAGLSAHGPSTVVERLPTRDHSERAFPAFGLKCEVHEGRIRVPGEQDAVAASDPLDVPGDPSSAAVWAAAAAALPGSSVVLEHVCLNPRRLGFVGALAKMGAEIQTSGVGRAGGEAVGSLTVVHGGHGSVTIGASEVPDLIDELPVLAARAALGGALDVTGAAELRVKESDRITALVTGLRNLGVDAEERPDGFTVRGAERPAGGTADAAGDHRLVMAFAIVGLGARGETSITGADAVAVSYPAFEADLARLCR